MMIFLTVRPQNFHAASHHKETFFDPGPHQLRPWSRNMPMRLAPRARLILPRPYSRLPYCAIRNKTFPSYDAPCNHSGIIRIKGSPVKSAFFDLIAATLFQVTAATAQRSLAVDPTIGFDRLFGLGGRTCKQYDDTGRLFLYSEGVPAPNVMAWLQMSGNGTKPNVPMPRDLADALPRIPGCMPGKHHAAISSSS
jgi:hypothetical protein